MKFLASLGLIAVLAFSGCLKGAKDEDSTANGDTSKDDDCSIEDEDCVLEFGKRHRKPSNRQRPEPPSLRAAVGASAPSVTRS